MGITLILTPLLLLLFSYLARRKYAEEIYDLTPDNATTTTNNNNDTTTTTTTTTNTNTLNININTSHSSVIENIVSTSPTNNSNIPLHNN
jgi:hypothetical protein